MNPYAASNDTAEPRSWRNFWRLMIAVGVLFFLPSLVVWGYLKYEQAHPTLFQSFENAAMDGDVERWNEMRRRNPAAATVPR